MIPTEAPAAPVITPAAPPIVCPSGPPTVLAAPDPPVATVTLVTATPPGVPGKYLCC